MNCYVCTKKIRKNLSELCSDCRYYKTISKTKAIKEFYLTEDELLDANIYCHESTVYGWPSNLFIRAEVEKLAADIFAKQELLDKRKIKYVNKFAIKARQDKINDFIDSTLSSEKKYIQFLKSKLQSIPEYILYINDEKVTYSHICKILMELYQTKSKNDYNSMKKLENIKNIILNNDFVIINNTTELSTYINNETIEHTDNDALNKHVCILQNKIDDHKQKQHRQNILTAKLKQKGLIIRPDSFLCKWYISGGINNVNKNLDGANITSIDDIVDIMDEMNWYYTKTNYDSINKNLIKKYTKKEYIYYDDSDDDDDDDDYNNGYRVEYVHIKSIPEINKEAKALAIAQLKYTFNAKQYSELPTNVKKIIKSTC